MVQEPPDEVREAWQRAVDRWDQPGLHELLLAAVVRHQCFAWAAARYKERAGDPIADRQLERVRQTATATLLATKPRRSDERMPYRSSIMALIVLVVMIVIGFAYAVIVDRTNVPPVTHGAGP